MSETVFEIVAATGRSVTIELKNDSIYRPDQPVNVYLSNKTSEEILSAEESQNVFSLYHLEPDEEYRIRIGSEEKTFRTAHESVCLDVRKFGAAGDGIHDDTAAIQAAILACPEEGTVYVPAADSKSSAQRTSYLTGPLFLKSNMTLWVDEGAELLASADRSRYPILPGMIRTTDAELKSVAAKSGSGCEDEVNFGTWEGNPLDMFASLITAIDCHDVNIIGQGILNGRGKEGGWWENPKEKKTAGSADGKPESEGGHAVHRKSGAAWRPNTIFLSRCSNVIVQGITVRNSPCWTVHPYYSDHLQFLNLNIENPYRSPNTDGFDPESCTDVLLLGTRIAVGDDCIAVKSGKLYMARKHFKRSSGITIRNCLLEHGHGSVTIGSEIAGGVSDVAVSQCIFHETDRGIRIKSRRGRGDRSVLDRLTFENIRMEGVHMPVTVNMFYFCDPDGHSAYVQNRSALPVDERTPRIGDITIRDVTCTGVHACVLTAYGLPEQPIGYIDVENLDASFAPAAEREPEVPVMAEDVPAMSGESVVICNAEKVRLSHVAFHSYSGEEIADPRFAHVRKLISE